MKASYGDRRLVFISHANPEDNQFVIWLSARLASAGYEVWSDVTQLVGGEVFWQDIEQAIRKHSVRFLSVLSPAAPTKRGFQKELSVADSIEGGGLLGDFIVPLRVGPLSYRDMPIYVHNKNAIDFLDKGWASGLAQLLEKLRKDEIPTRAPDRATKTISQWASQFLRTDDGIVVADEPVVSNWLSIERLPPTIFISAFSLTPKSAAPLQAQWPCQMLGRHLISFAKPADFNLNSGMSGLRQEAEVETLSFLGEGAASLPALSHQDRSNVVTDILRQAWSLNAASLGLVSFGLANQNLCWFWPREAGSVSTPIERTKFVDAFGRSGSRALIGESRKLGAFWHYAIEAVPATGANLRFGLQGHVIFTADGHTPLYDSARMHRLRRRFCKQWWQDRWRDLMSAYVSKLSYSGSVLVPVAAGKELAVSRWPLTYISPVTAMAPETTGNLVEAQQDDADLIYDQAVGDDNWDVDNEDGETA